MSTKPVSKQVVPGKGGAESAHASRGAVRPRDSLFHWCGTADAIRQESDREEKRSLLEAYFGAVAANGVAPAARFFSGAVLPRQDARAIVVEVPLLMETIRGLTGRSAEKMDALVAKAGTLASAAAELFSGRLPSGLSVNDAEHWFDDLADRPSPSGIRALLRDMFARVSGIEAGYVVKLLQGELDIGLEDEIIEAALSSAFAEPQPAVHRALLRHRDLGIVAQLARWHALDNG